MKMKRRTGRCKNLLGAPLEVQVPLVFVVLVRESLSWRPSLERCRLRFSQWRKSTGLCKKVSGGDGEAEDTKGHVVPITKHWLIMMLLINNYHNSISDRFSCIFGASYIPLDVSVTQKWICIEVFGLCNWS
ncbi:hypothetical protein CFOL_v3_20128 [Cephalotus follicularis]|uniref:Uncharacterized protein n=1 Tax=Cephalotus follicularis TaxID=3775 RepID=A0A1Q3C8R4_CEPFO|nr:hypothetical protein CFOL_v3_20128 [Cephalotus follicularis]